MNAKENQKTIGNGFKTEHTTTGDITAFQPIRILVKRRWQLVACLLLVCSIAFAATALRKPKYEATAKVQVVMDQPQMGGIAALAGGANGDYFTTQCQLLRSRHVLSRTAEKLNADSGNWSYTDEGLKDLQKHLKVKPISGSRLIDIVGVADTGPEAAAIANQLTASFIETSTEARQATNTRIAQRVQEQIQTYGKEIDGMEGEINTFRKENLITGADSSLQAVESRINMIEKELTDAQMKRLELEAQKDKISRMLTSGKGLSDDEILLTEINSNGRVNYLRQTLNSLQEEEVQLAQAYLPGHQKLRNIRIRIADLQAKLMDQKRKLLQALYENIVEEYSATASQEDSLLGILNHQKEVGVKLTQRHQEYQKLLADYEMSQKFKTECIAQLRQFNLKEGMSESPVKVVDAAHIPTKPAGLNKVHQAVSILLLGLLFSVAFIFVLERFSMEAQVPAQQSPKPMYIPVGMQPGMNWANMYGQPTYPMDMPFQASSPEQSDMAAMEMAGTSTDLSQILGQLNNIELGGDSFGNLAFSARCRIVHTDQSSSPAESFREIGSQLLSRFGNTQQNIVITGDSDQNGKTTCACNLALFLAQSGRKVLLIDANRNKPALHRVFTASKGTPGLSDVLEDVSLLDEALQSAQVENLMIIHNSIDDDRAVDHDISRLSSLNQELRQRFDWIIYDTASIVDEFAKEILQVVGKTLFVTTDTELSAQHAATEQIEICGALNLGFVHNSYCTSSSSLSQEQELTSKG